jgi:hypothetical protein
LFSLGGKWVVVLLKALPMCMSMVWHLVQVQAVFDLLTIDIRVQIAKGGINDILPGLTERLIQIKGAMEIWAATWCMVQAPA